MEKLSLRERGLAGKTLLSGCERSDMFVLHEVDTFFHRGPIVVPLTCGNWSLEIPCDGPALIEVINLEARSVLQQQNGLNGCVD